MLVKFLSRHSKISLLTIGDIQNEGASYEKRDNLHCISNRLKLRGCRGVEPHVPDDDSGERVDNAIGDGPRELLVKIYPEFLLGVKTYAAKTEVKSRRAFGSKKPTRACFLSNALFLMPVSLSETRLTARSLWR